MLFVAILVISAGYNLLYAGIKGDNYTINGTSVWRAPWLPYVMVFSGRSAGLTSLVTTTDFETQYQTAGAPAAAPAPVLAPSGPGGTSGGILA